MEYPEDAGKWVRLENILVSELVDRRTVGRFYVSVVQEVLLFGSEMWVLTPQLEKSLERFHHLVVRRMAGMGPKRQWDGTWVYPSIGVVLAMLGVDKIGVYISHHQNTGAQYIATCPITDLCLVVERNPVMLISSRWWKKPSLYILGVRVRHAAVEGGGGDEDGIIRGIWRVG